MPTIKEYFQNIATAIKQKNSEIVTVTPAQMPQAILDIPSGGGGIEPITPLVFDSHNGWLSGDGGTYTYSPNPSYVTDIYSIEYGHVYIVTMGNITRGDRFRAGMFNKNPATTTSNIVGHAVYGVNNPTIRDVAKFSDSYNGYDYLCVQKDVSGTTGIKSYVIDVTEWS